MAAVPPPTLDYASRKRRRMTVEDWRELAADCWLVCTAVAVASVGGFATAYVLHEVFVFCFGN
jgi:hypothetical protein